MEREARAGKKDELAHRITKQVLPILRNQLGFADMIALSDDVHPKHLVLPQLLEVEEDAKQYHRERYEQIVNMIRSLNH